VAKKMRDNPLFVVFEILVGLVIAIILAGITMTWLNLGVWSFIGYLVVGGTMTWRTEWKTSGWTVILSALLVVLVHFA